DVLRILQPDLRPPFAAIARLVDAVTGRDAAAELALPRADVDDVRIRRRDGDRADRGARDLVVRDVLPCHAAVARLPEAAASRPEVILERTLNASRDRDRSPPAQRSETAPAQRAEGARALGDRGTAPAPLGGHGRLDGEG